MLRLQNVSTVYPCGADEYALYDISLDFRQSELVAIVGETGSGKSTLLNIIGAQGTQGGGNVIVKGISTDEFNDKNWAVYRNCTVGFVSQKHEFIEHITVLQNIELVVAFTGANAAECNSRAIYILEEVGLGDVLDKRPGQLSVGQKQKAAIAKALVNDPDIIIADEPTAMLDSTRATQVMEILKDYADTRLVLMATTNHEQATAFATRIIEIKSGRIRNDTNPPTKNDLAGEDWEKKEQPLAEFSTGEDTSTVSFLPTKRAINLGLDNLRAKKKRTLVLILMLCMGLVSEVLVCVVLITLVMCVAIAQYYKDVYALKYIGARKKDMFVIIGTQILMLLFTAFIVAVLLRFIAI